VALASTALIALLISGVALNQILPGYFEEQGRAQTESAAQATALLIVDTANRPALREFLTDQALREERIIQPAAQEAADGLLVTVEVINVVDGSEAAFAQPEDPEELESAAAQDLAPDAFAPATRLAFSIELPLSEQPLAPNGTLNMEVTVSVPFTGREATLAQVRGALVGAGALALLVSLGVGVWAARRLTVPLSRLGSFSSRLARGHLDARVPPAGVEEIDQLGDQFNLMADRLTESLRLLESDRDRLREFVADVSHELRTPLAALRTYTEFQRDGAVDEATRHEFLDRSSEQLSRLEWMSANLLDLSRIDAGIFPLDVKIGDLREPVRAAVEATAETAATRQIGVTYVAPSTAVAIRFDRERIVQLVNNLVGNAVKFTPAGGTVAVRVEDQADGAVIEVSDNGPGIPPAELPRIFDRFYRGTNVGEARASGSGLGLAIARSIVEMHGGFIEVASVLGEGAVFRVVLPRQGAAAAGELAGETGERAEPAAEPVPDEVQAAADLVNESSPRAGPAPNPRSGTLQR
jgi:signal transduction histidine kinase